MAGKKRGQPTKFRPKFNREVEHLCKLGATDEQLAAFFNVHLDTINNWKKKHPKFFEAIKRGKVEADRNVAQSLYHRALGYSHKEDKIFQYEGKPVIVPTIKHYPPDPTAAIFWLKNRQPADWRDKHELEHTGHGLNIKVTLKEADESD